VSDGLLLTTHKGFSCVSCALLFRCSRDSSSWNRDGWLSCLSAQGIVALSKMCAQEMSKICTLGDRVVL
jgi:hypothetical protein